MKEHALLGASPRLLCFVQERTTLTLVLLTDVARFAIKDEINETRLGTTLVEVQERASAGLLFDGCTAVLTPKLENGVDAMRRVLEAAGAKVRFVNLKVLLFSSFELTMLVWQPQVTVITSKPGQAMEASWLEDSTFFVSTMEDAKLWSSFQEHGGVVYREETVIGSVERQKWWVEGDEAQLKRS